MGKFPYHCRSHVTDIRVTVGLDSHVSRTIKLGLGMGCDYGQDQRNIFVTE
jgi:hypothetical protein